MSSRCTHHLTRTPPPNRNETSPGCLSELPASAASLILADKDLLDDPTDDVPPLGVGQAFRLSAGYHLTSRFEIGVFTNGVCKVGVCKVGVCKVGVCKGGVCKVGACKVGISKVGA